MEQIGIIEVNSFWDKKACEEAISTAENAGFNHATVSNEHGEQFALHARNNRRVIVEDLELTSKLWRDLRVHVPINMGNSRVCGLNELLRYYKYETGQKFQRHRDQSFIRDQFEASYLTVLVYLNDGFEGGATSFQGRKVIPETGKCVVFPHHLEHEGSEVHHGVKYVLRTDVMYRLEVD